MKNISTYILLLFISHFVTSQNVGINTVTPNASSILDINSNNAGLLIPRLTEVQRTGIATPDVGLLVYQINNVSGFWYYNGANWVLLGSNVGWGLTGDALTNPANNFVGTTDNQDFVLKTNNMEVIRFQVGGNIGIRTNNPTAKLHLNGRFRIQDGTQAINRVLTSDANGFGTWQNVPTTSLSDEDWIFSSAGTTYSDPVYHAGTVTIGVYTPNPYTLHVNAGGVSGSKMQFGSIEDFEDGLNEFIFRGGFRPRVNNSLTLGKPTNRWTEIWAANGMIQTSDLNHKERVTDLDYGLNEVLKLNPVSFYWKQENFDGYIVPDNKKRKHLGFIAQELHKVVPEIVETRFWNEHEDNKGVLIEENMPRLGVSYSEMIPVLVKAVQEQELFLRKLELQNAELEKALKDIENNN